MRKIPMKNYIIACLITIVTVFTVFTLMNIYNKREVKLDFLTEVKEADLNYYIAENSDVYIYMTTGKKSKNIDKEFKKYIKNKDLKNRIIYIDLDEVSSDFEANFIKKYVTSSSIKFEKKDPTIAFIDNGLLVDSNSDIKSFEDIKSFFERSTIK